MNNNKYFLDANIIINILNKDTGSPEEEARRSESLQRLSSILENCESEFYISSFIRLEVLRCIINEDEYEKAQEYLKNLAHLEENKTEDVINKTIEFSRFCRQERVPTRIGTKRVGAMDYIHFITAKYYELEILSFDDHIELLEEKYAEYEGV